MHCDLSKTTHITSKEKYKFQEFLNHGSMYTRNLISSRFTQDNWFQKSSQKNKQKIIEVYSTQKWKKFPIWMEFLTLENTVN